jgi:hypothetical protein
MTRLQIVPSKFVQIAVGGGIHHADDGVALALEHDPPGIDLAGEPLGVVVAMKVEDADKFLAEGQASDGVAELKEDPKNLVLPKGCYLPLVY